MICAIFLLPSSPSRERRSSAGMPTVSSWIMIEALMYGLMPKANSVALESDEPVIDDISSRKEYCSSASPKMAASMPGTGI